MNPIPEESKEDNGLIPDKEMPNEPDIGIATPEISKGKADKLK